MSILKKVNFYIIILLSILMTNIVFSKSEIIFGETFLALRDQHMGKNKQFINNSNIRIIIQDEVEEAHEVSMVVKLPEILKKSKKIMILVDDNPIQLVTKLYPKKPIKSVGLNIRMEQDSFVRAAVLDSKGVWNISSKKVIVKSPGGCSLPACDPTKEICKPLELGKMLVQKYKRSSGNWRLKLKINHPMDTGLVTDPSSGKIIPEYYVNWVYIKDSTGELAKAQTFGALSANPIFVLDFYDDFNVPEITATDTKGKEFSL